MSNVRPCNECASKGPLHKYALETGETEDIIKDILDDTHKHIVNALDVMFSDASSKDWIVYPKMAKALAAKKISSLR